MAAGLHRQNTDCDYLLFIIFMLYEFIFYCGGAAACTVAWLQEGHGFNSNLGLLFVELCTVVCLSVMAPAINWQLV